jgi:5'-3' exonuclease
MNVVLIDAKYLLYVQHWAHAQLTTQGRFPTGGIYGFLKEMLRMHEAWPAHQVFCWDGQGPSWKKEGGTGYKANRQITPDVAKVQAQAQVLQKLLLAMGFHSPCIPGVEGDDLIGLLAYLPWDDKPFEIRIYSGDKDMYQLVSRNVKVWKKFYKRGGAQPKLEVIDAVRVKQEMGVAPDRVSDLRAMIGDPSDNLKGLPGIGPKKALALLMDGIKPWVRWQDLNSHKQIQLAEFKEDWPRLNQEHRIIQIPTSLKASNWPEEKQMEIAKVMNEILASPERKKVESSSETWLSFLGRYELKELWEERNRIWEIK